MRLALPQPCLRTYIPSCLYLILFFFVLVDSELPPPCDNEIYCHGELLHTVQMAHLYPDSKTFVDMKLRATPNETLYQFQRFLERTHGRPSQYDTERFVNDNFEPAGSEFEEWVPSDWTERPGILSRIKDPAYRSWASELNHVWKLLGKKMKADVQVNPHLYSIIPVPNPVIVPGGRFREFYYWDSYWIVKGLLHSEMYHTTKGMLENFLSIVERYGHIPNGGRVYYLERSQPPFLGPMIGSYVEKTKDMDFLKQALPILELEFSYWLTNHSVSVLRDGANYTLFRYIDRSQGPRPESYREDVESAALFRTESEKQDHYSELKAAAESGWDFSSRWFIQNGTNKGNLTDLKTKYILPVDLNAVVCWNAQLLADFYKSVGDMAKAAEYLMHVEQISLAVEKVLWIDDIGVWLDYDIMNDKERGYFYPTNISPLWTGCFDKKKKEYFVGKVMKYIQLKQIMLNLGGIPTTLEHTGEQWDFPNAWPPLQHIMVEALADSGDAWAEDLGFEIASRWVKSNFVAFNETGHMFEKYDATAVGGHGTGGEYEVQLGFGWTNGVILDLLHRYSDKLRAHGDFDPLPYQDGPAAPAPKAPSPAPVSSSSIGLVVSVALMSIVLVVLAVGAGVWYWMFKRGGSGRTADYRSFYRGGDYQELRSFL